MSTPLRSAHGIKARCLGSFRGMDVCLTRSSRRQWSVPLQEFAKASTTPLRQTYDFTLEIQLYAVVRGSLGRLEAMGRQLLGRSKVLLSAIFISLRAFRHRRGLYVYVVRRRGPGNP
jgi:hypothetical protein